MSFEGQAFRRLPGLQSAAEQDYRAQAQSAHGLGKRLGDTRREAERVAMEEIARTRRLQAQLLTLDAEWQAWEAERQRLEQQAGDWERQAQAEKMGREVEIGQLEGRQQELVQRLSELEGLLTKRQQEWAMRQAERGRLEMERDTLHAQWQTAQQAATSPDLGPLWEQANALRGQLEKEQAAGHQADLEFQALRTQEQTLTMETTGPVPMIEGEDRLERAKDDLLQAHKAKQEAQTALTSLSFSPTGYEQLAKQRDEAFHQLGEQTHLLEQCRQQREEAMGKLQVEEHNRGNLQERRAHLQRELASIQAELSQVTSQLAALDTSNWANQLQIREQRFIEASQGYEKCKSLVEELNSRLGEAEARAQQVATHRAQLEAKLQEAEQETRQAEALVAQCEEQMRVQREAQSQHLKWQYERRQELDRLRLQLQGLEAEQITRQAHLRQLQDHLESLNQSIMQRTRAGEEAQRRATELQQRYQQLEQQLRAFILVPPSHTEQDLQELRRQLADTQERLRQLKQQGLPGANPWPGRLAVHEGAKERLEQAIRQRWLTQPPSALQTQLHVEAEAIMRAELAKAVEQRQEKIVGEADALASIHVKSEPHFDLDETARSTLIAEHQQVGVGEEEIAGTVLDMCKQSHIHA